LRAGGYGLADVKTRSIAAVVVTLFVCTLFLLGCGASASNSRTTTIDDAAVVRVYAEAFAFASNHQKKRALRFVDLRHVGRDVWVVTYRWDKDRVCLALELDRITFDAIRQYNWNKSGTAQISCSAISSHE
jgi:hypothetical protein